MVLFCDPEADAAIYSNKSNVRRSDFYRALKRKSDENMPLNIVDVSEHAARRKLLNLAFTERSLRPASMFMITHVDRWHQIILDENHGAKEWTAPRDLSSDFDGLVFDILSDLCFGKSFDLKEPGDNPMKGIPHNIAEYMRFYYPVSVSLPSLHFCLSSSLPPRGSFSLEWMDRSYGGRGANFFSLEALPLAFYLLVNLGQTSRPRLANRFRRSTACAQV